MSINPGIPIRVLAPVRQRWAFGAAARRRRIFIAGQVALLALTAVVFAGNAMAEKFLVLSLVGNQVTLVKQENSAGSHLDRNRYETMPINDTAIDDTALLAVKAALLKARPDATVEFLRARDPKAYSDRSTWLEQNSPVMRELMSALAREAESSPGVRLVLVAPVADQPVMRRADVDPDSSQAAGGGTKNKSKAARMGHTVGTGRVSGLGFYVGSDVEGLGMFANVQLALINLRNGTIAAHERIIAGVTDAAALVPNPSAQGTLSGQEKFEAMQVLLNKEIATAMPSLIRADSASDAVPR
ncbi:MAG: hypothetical protein ABI607_05895 [Betaproteobacteria bacterium]